MWSKVIEKLQNGEAVTVSASGNSMSPRIKKGEKVTIKPTYKPHVGDIVVAWVRGRIYCHLITKFDPRTNRYEISNNHGHVNGWADAEKIYGKVVE